MSKKTSVLSTHSRKTHSKTGNIRRLLIYSFFWAIVYCIAALMIVLYFGRDLPSFEQLENIRPKLMTKVYSADGKILKRFAEQRRDAVPYQEIPVMMIDAVTAVEDRRFWRHWGIDLRGVTRAAFVNIVARRSAQGASTITQQLSRNLFLTLDVSLSRKIKEMITAVRIERTYTKEEILEMYLNQVYFGHGMWGLQSASEYYFGKNARNLTLSECALLAGLLKAPTDYSPRDHPQRALRRRDIVIDAMAKYGKITKAQAAAAKRARLSLSSVEEEEGSAPYFLEYVRQQLEAKYGSHILYEDGASVYTTLNAKVQQAAENTFFSQLRDVQKATGISPSTRPVQGAFVAIDPTNGHILAMIGGRDYGQSQFNRATQALRQPGSAFKPFIYTAVIDNGRQPTDQILDTALSVPMPDGTTWTPENYDKTFGGLMTLRDALAHSRNLATIRLFTNEWTTPKDVVVYAKKMGIRSPLHPYLSIALGSEEVTLMELTSAYGVFPNGGIVVEPVAILKVVDKDGTILEEQERGKEDVALSRQTAAIVADMLRSVVEYGTGHNIRDQWGFTRPAGGKTGTTDNYTDAWFVGFTPQIVAGVWVGFDEKVPLGAGQTGAQAALPAWARFMQKVYTNLRLPIEDFSLPPGLVRVDVCAETYRLAAEYCPKKFAEVFREDDVPKETCPKHSLEAGTSRPQATPEHRMRF